MRADPIGLQGGIDVFIYAYNNPINNYDPTGLEVPGLGDSGFWNCDLCNKKKKEEDDCEKKTCAEKYPELEKCSYLRSGWSYKYNSKQEAINAYGIKNARADKPDNSTKGPCVGKGKHYRVTAKDYGWIGSITSCPCCEDTPDGAKKKTVWRAHW